jgi:uncharacterized repeat protein (TIGR02543 family)
MMAQLILYTDEAFEAARYIFDYTVNTDSADSYKITGKMLFQAKGDGDFLKAVIGSGSLYFGTSTGNRVQTTSVHIPFTNLSTSWTTVGQTGEVSFTVSKAHAAQTLAFWPGNIGLNFFNSSGTNSYISEPSSSSFSATMTIGARRSYPVSYNANGGTGGPTTQTKWYGETLTIPISQPTRAGHRFIGWATSSTATSASYSPGSSYTGNAPLSLYAVWQKMPVISDIALVRVNSNEVPDEAGGYIKVTASYQSDYAVTDSSISVGEGSVNTGTFPVGTGTITAVLGNGANIFPLRAYTATVSMTSQAGTSTGTGSLAASSSYSRPTVSIDSFYRAPSTSGSDSRTEDDLGRFLYAAYTISFTATASQRGLSSVTRRFASLEQSAVVITPSPVPESVIGPVVGSEETWSQQFDYTQIAPGTAHANELTITVSDKFYSATATADLGSGAYFQPRIPSINAIRSDVSGNADDEGKTATVTFDWSVTPSVTQTAPQSVLVSAYDMSDTLIASRTISPSTTSTTTVMTFNSSDRAQGAPVISPDLNDLFDTDQKYTITVILNDLYTSTSKSDVLSTAYFTFDVLAGGHGVAFGKPASTAELMDVGYEIHSDTEVSATDGNSVVHNLTEKADQSDVDALVTGVSGVKGNAEADYRTGNVNITPANIGAQPAGTYVTGVKGNSESSYRSGNVNLTPANIGAASSSHTHNYAGSSSAGGHAYYANYLDVVAGNEIRFNKNGNSPTVLWFNWKWSDASTSPVISEYIFGNCTGGGTAKIVCNGISFRKVIYNNGPTNGVVYMNDYAYNYNHMRIYYYENNGYRHSVDVADSSCDGMTVLLPCPMSINNEQCTLKLKQVYISGSTISVSNSASGSIYSGYNSTRSGSANEVYIIRVDAWNE